MSNLPELLPEDLLNSFLLQEEALAALYDSSQIDKDTYCKLLCELAYGFAQSKYIDEAIRVLAGCPDEYFKDIILGQMAEDEGFLTITWELAMLLLASGTSFLPGVGVGFTGKRGLA